jgi:uroporphyrinogen-III synthase
MADTAAPLAGCRVWVTRPRGQSARLCELVRGSGGEVLEFPLLEILPARDEAAARALLGRVAEHDFCIFISRSAVRHALRLCPGFGARLGSCRVLAVGAGTAAELAAAGIDAQCGPGPAFSAADLLTIPTLLEEAVRGRAVLIARGEGGGAMLGATLAARGARVCHVDVYRRAVPAPDPAAGLLWRRSAPDVIVVTSAEAVRALLALTPPAHHTALLGTALIVISRRVRDAARAAGFAGAVVVASAASDAGLHESLLAWRARA